jgi:hypothetical protein
MIMKCIALALLITRAIARQTFIEMSDPQFGM